VVIEKRRGHLEGASIKRIREGGFRGVDDVEAVPLLVGKRRQRHAPSHQQRPQYKGPRRGSSITPRGLGVVVHVSLHPSRSGREPVTDCISPCRCEERSDKAIHLARSPRRKPARCRVGNRRTMRRKVVEEVIGVARWIVTGLLRFQLARRCGLARRFTLPSEDKEHTVGGAGAPHETSRRSGVMRVNSRGRVPETLQYKRGTAWDDRDRRVSVVTQQRFSPRS
jgi:hypothetical protein